MRGAPTCCGLQRQRPNNQNKAAAMQINERTSAAKLADATAPSSSTRRAEQRRAAGARSSATRAAAPAERACMLATRLGAEPRSCILTLLGLSGAGVPRTLRNAEDA